MPRALPVLALAAALASAALLTGCGTPARPLELAVTEMDSLQLRSWVSPQLRRNVLLLPVRGGQETSRWWGSRVSDQSLNQAYQESLRRLGLMADVPDAGHYELRVQLLAMAQPPLPVQPDVAVSVNYTLTERGATAPLYQRTLRTNASAGVSDSLNPHEQLRMASESALRNNIAELIRELASLQLPPMGSTVPAPATPATPASAPAAPPTAVASPVAAPSPAASAPASPARAPARAKAPAAPARAGSSPKR